MQITKRKIYKALLLVCVIIITTSFKHPIKLTASLIEYDTNTANLKSECKVFIDDFEKSINKKLVKIRIHKNNMSNAKIYKKIANTTERKPIKNIKYIKRQHKSLKKNFNNEQ
jgi:MinD-like ATPase involved in chromosome partitioning or flagellar assembly